MSTDGSNQPIQNHEVNEIGKICSPTLFALEFQMKPDSTVIKVADQTGDIVQFRVRNNAPFKKMMNAYCEKKVRPTSVE